MQTPFLRSRIHRLRPSATLAINERSSELVQAGRTVYRLGFGQSPFPVPAAVVAALQQAAFIKDYLPVQGLPELRQAVARFNRSTLGMDCQAEHVLIGPGSKELIYHVQLALDADLLLPSPSWVSYEPQAQLAGQAVHWLDTTEAKGWKLDPDALAQAASHQPKRRKLLILNYPNNPTGTSYTRAELVALAEVARQQQIVVLADEIYGELHHQGQHHSMAQYYPEGTLISSGLSKWCGAGGWRLGTMSFPSELDWLLRAMCVIASETFTSVSAPVQHAAVAAFNGGPEIRQYIHNSRRILAAVAQYVYRALVALRVSCPPADGGFYLFPNFAAYREALAKRGISTSSAMCEYFLQEWGIALLPGSAFGRPVEELTARLSFVDFDGAAALESLLSEPEQVPDQAWIQQHCPRMVAAMEALRSGLGSL
ncbi:MAG: aminotransferase class I/II-fold pyridoxal phosphate-dependent enzyme [Bacteroidetes bacterium]|nr:MAG: aminotransferase class I/II-fold pyridoxal phosphate-dependent enzyme [Bacteroidota bacterium]